MDLYYELANEIFDLEGKKCKCNGGHKLCLGCEVCKAKNQDCLPDLNKPIAGYIDHTNLKPEATRFDIKILCSEAEEFGFKTICINSTNIITARNKVEKSMICSVIGFPLGAVPTNVKVFETKQAITDGAKEIDMVINIGELKSKEYSYVLKDISEVAKVCHENGAKLKVIIETCLLNKAEKIISVLLAKKAGADFVKTSTGMNKAGATIEDVKMMREIVGPKMGVKAAGGIRNYETAYNMLKAGANRIGASQSIKIANKVSE
jgi:deoxyribose-phosphate aldolase